LADVRFSVCISRSNSTSANDPHEERDYGSFDHCDREVWFKIDYYNLTMDGASEDPADPAKTKRIMTIGPAQDW
jgi:hypothetical protein